MQRPLPLLTLIAVCFLGTACATHHAEVADARFKGASRSSFAATAVRAAAAKAPVDRFLLLEGRKPGGLGFVQATPDTWGPFDISIQTGFLDPESMQSPFGVQTCLEIDTVGFSMFYDVCGVFGPTGWTVTAFTHAIRPLPGSVLIDADEIDLRVEQTGSDVNFYARASGAMAWTQVSTTPFAAQTVPLKAAFGATGLSKGTGVGYDSLAYAATLVMLTPGPVAVARDVNDGLLALYSAFESLDGAGPDFGAAAASLDDAADALDDAQLGLLALPETKDNARAAKNVSKAQKGLPKLQGRVADLNADKALKSLPKLARSLVEAALLLNPQPFP